MTDEELLICMVQTWAGELFPDNPHVGKRAAALALSVYIGGASLTEACHEARVFLTGRARHPAGRGRFPTRPMSKVAQEYGFDTRDRSASRRKLNSANGR